MPYFVFFIVPLWKRFLWLFLLLNQLPFCLSDADHSSNYAANPCIKLTSAITNFPNIDINAFWDDCATDTETGLIALGSAGTGLSACSLLFCGVGVVEAAQTICFAVNKIQLLSQLAQKCRTFHPCFCLYNSWWAGGSLCVLKELQPGNDTG